MISKLILKMINVDQRFCLGLEERHWHCNFNLSGEEDREERGDGGIPMGQGFHREYVRSLILTFQKFTSRLILKSSWSSFSTEETSVNQAHWHQ